MRYKPIHISSFLYLLYRTGHNPSTISYIILTDSVQHCSSVSILAL